MVDGKRRYKSDRKDHKVSVKLSEKRYGYSESGT